MTLGASPRCLSLFHLIPAAFIVGIVITTVLAVLGYPFLSILMWIAYVLLCIAMTIENIMRAKHVGTNLLLPVVFFLLHVSYGIGTWVGIAKMPWWLNKRKKNEELL